jgi:hypothetical protein
VSRPGEPSGGLPNSFRGPETVAVTLLTPGALALALKSAVPQLRKAPARVAVELGDVPSQSGSGPEVVLVTVIV